MKRRWSFFNDVGSSADGAVGSVSMVGRPFLSMLLSAADPEPDSSSFCGLSAKVKMVLPICSLIGLFAWDVSLQLSSGMSGSPPLDASMISVARSRLMSGLIRHSFAPVGVNSALRGVMCTRMSCLFFLSSIQRSCFRDTLCVKRRQGDVPWDAVHRTLQL